MRRLKVGMTLGSGRRVAGVQRFIGASAAWMAWDSSLRRLPPGSVFTSLLSVLTSYRSSLPRKTMDVFRTDPRAAMIPPGV